MKNRWRIIFFTGCILILLPVFASLADSANNAQYHLPVLIYHRVGYTSNPLTVTPERFAHDLAALKENG